MKANKIVFSTIAALALSSSAFATSAGFTADFDINEPWKDQVYKSGATGSRGSLSQLGWSDGATGIIAAITGDTDAQLPGTYPSDSKSVLGSLNSLSGKTVEAKLNQYGSSGTNEIKGTSADLGLDNLTANLTSTGVSAYSLENATKDYLLADAAYKNAKKAKLLYDVLDTTTAGASTIGSSTDLSQSSSGFELTDSDKTPDNMAKIKNALLTHFKADLTAEDITNLGKAELVDGEVQTAVQNAFGGLSTAYKKAANFKELGTDLDNIKALRDDIKTKADEILTHDGIDPNNAPKIKKLRAQLDEMVETYYAYKNVADKEKTLTTKKTALFTDETGWGTTYGDFEAAVTAAAAKTTKADIKSTLSNQIASKITEKTTGDSISKVAIADGIKLTDATKDSKKITLSQAMDLIEKNSKSTTDNATDIGTDGFVKAAGSTHLTTYKKIYDALKEINTAITEKRTISISTMKGIASGVTNNDTLEACIDELNTIIGDDVLALTTTDIKAYNKAIALGSEDTKIDAYVEALGAFNAAKDSFKLPQSAAVVEQIAQAKQAIGKSISANSAVASSLAELEQMSYFTDTKGVKSEATKKSLEAYGADLFGTGINENSTALMEKFGVSVDDFTSDTEGENPQSAAQKAVAALKAKMAAEYAEVGVTLDGGELKYGGAALDAAAMQKIVVAHHNNQLQKVANKVATAVAESKKDSLAVEGLSTLNIQLNNMNKRLGEIRGLDGEIGVWLRTWGGKMSADNDSFKYYSTQLGADKKTAMKDGDLYLGVLVGYDNVKSDIKSNAYSVGAYASYIDNSGFFADGVMKFVSTKNERSGFDLSNQQTLLASIEGGYRFDMSDGFYVEPSLEFVTGHVGEYKSHEQGSKTTLKVDSFTPVVFKPQVFVGGSADAFTYRAGVGGVLSMQGQDASVEVANLAKTIADDPKAVNGSGSVKLSKNNHGFASIGGSFKASENFRINLVVERSFGGDLTNDYEVNMTLRYGF